MRTYTNYFFSRETRGMPRVLKIITDLQPSVKSAQFQVFYLNLELFF